MRSSSNTFDVVVLGGGPAGCAAALALASHGVEQTLIVEASRYDAVRLGESIPPDTRLLLAELGIWDDFAAENHEPCLGSCSSWGSDALGYNDFLCNPLGNGWHLDRTRFDRFLAHKAEQRGAELRLATKFGGIEQSDDDGFVLRLQSEQWPPSYVTAKYVVDATGQNAAFARRAGARKVFLDRLSCAAGVFRLPHDAAFPRLTMLEAVSDGWWYAARIPNGSVAVALACDAELLRRESLHERDPWLLRLSETQHIAEALAHCGYTDGSLTVRTAPSYLLDRAEGHRWIAIGDAASAYDPISSQGIYKALSTALHAAPLIASFLNGSTRETSDYTAAVARDFDDYRKHRNFFYDTERRWPEAPFWKHRTAAAPQWRN
ncbi:MAG TPA: tryptophan 7-halogenase [Thermoanaerobaculia bacterium]|nr:tryptophan 7-halogenase [Thermoanaerobaculia bacterium]